MNTQVQTLVSQFSAQLAGLVEDTVKQRIQGALASAGLGQKRGRGRPPKFGLWNYLVQKHLSPERIASAHASAVQAARPKQLCPVPKCTRPAAPVYGMVCKEHRKVAKSTIARYRELRRAAKAGPRVAVKLQGAPLKKPAKVKKTKARK